MQAILIAYGTTDGHTARIAGFLGSILQTSGAKIDVVRTAGFVSGFLAGSRIPVQDGRFALRGSSANR